jgi:demethylmenaquinone methyltransferase/2-methoxy-6-polyprenyl-1,4-benzoquinol methylase
MRGSPSQVPVLGESERARYVQGMFERIAPRYDLLNRLMTAGQDRRWRKMVIRLCDLPDGGKLLDLGAGTGDLSGEALRHAHSRHSASCRPLAADFTFGMLKVGKERYGDALDWCTADALVLPFADESFDAVVSGFLLRNVVDLPQAIGEQYRVLKPGGRLVALDTTRPRRSMFTPFIHFYMHTIIPFLGRIISRQVDAYRYLPETSEGFLASEELQGLISTAGFSQVGFTRLMFGTIAIHWATRSE